MNNPTHNSKRILIIEDDAATVRALKEVMLCEGYEVHSAANGVEALNRLENQELPSVILADLMMPLMSGPEFRKRQLENPKTAGIPLIVISGSRDGANAAKQMGVKHYLEKPIQIADLLTILAEI